MYDCRAGGSRFSFALNLGRRAGFAAWSKVAFLTRDRQQGAAFVAAFARGFQSTVPQAPAPQPRETVQFAAAVFGTNLTPDLRGGLTDGAGTWTAAKVFLEYDSMIGEVFLNFSEKERRGELRMKDPEYTAPLVAVLAAVLRDGPRARRTAADDPHLVPSGPTIQPGTPLGPKAARLAAVCPQGDIVLLSEKIARGWRLLATKPMHPDAGRELIHLTGRPGSLHCLDPNARTLVMREEFPDDPSAYSTEDPAVVLWWQTGHPPERLLWPKASARQGLGEQPVSPDGRLVALLHWQKAAGGRSYASVLLLDRRTGQHRTVTDPAARHSYFQVGWRRDGGVLYAVIRQGFAFEKTSSFFGVDPLTGKQRPLPAEEIKQGRRRAPDGKRLFQLVDRDALLIFDRPGGPTRRLPIHPDDRPFAEGENLTWVSSRYLYFATRYPLFIDTETLKTSYAAAPGVLGAIHGWDPRLRWVLHFRDRLWVSRIEQGPAKASPKRPVSTVR